MLNVRSRESLPLVLYQWYIPCTIGHDVAESEAPYRFQTAIWYRSVPLAFANIEKTPPSNAEYLHNPIISPPNQAGRQSLLRAPQQQHVPSPYRFFTRVLI